MQLKPWTINHECGDKSPPHKVAEEILYLMEQQGSTLEALGELILITDSSKITDSTLEDIGRMLEMCANNLMKTAMKGVRVCQPINSFD